MRSPRVRSGRRRSLAVAGLAAVILAGCGGAGPSAALVSGSSTSTTPTASTTTTASTGTTLPATTTTTTAMVAPAATRPVTTVAPIAASGSGVAGTVRFGPVCPVERIPPDPACAPRPGAASIRLEAGGGRPAITGTAGADGRFSIPAPPGVYAVSATATPASPGRGCGADPSPVTVVAGTFVSVSVLCDTGIR